MRQSPVPPDGLRGNTLHTSPSCERGGEDGTVVPLFVVLQNGQGDKGDRLRAIGVEGVLTYSSRSPSHNT